MHVSDNAYVEINSAVIFYDYEHHKDIVYKGESVACSCVV